jgi:uncharacterized protein
LRRSAPTERVPAPLELTLRDARRLSVMGQLLSSPRPGSIEDVVRGLWMVQMDPTAAVARTEHLVLWSRLGSRFKAADLERLLWDERTLFEYWVHIVPTSDYAVHRESMRRYPEGPRGDFARRAYVREWLDANAAFRRYILRELRRRGPLRSRDLEDRAAVPWRTGGWNDARPRHTAMLLDILWDRGEVMIVGREGQQRLWDLAERRLPAGVARPPQREVARSILERQLRARGVATMQQFGFAFDGRPPGWERALRELVREGVAVPSTIDGIPGDWFAHAELLDRPFRPRTALLSPFDDLVSDRDRTEQLFGFRFRLEIYVPKAKREFGYFVLPVLHGDRLVGRIDPKFDRRTGVLHVHAVHAEPDVPASAGPAVARAIHELARWLGADDVAIGIVPQPWRGALT